MPKKANNKKPTETTAEEQRIAEQDKQRGQTMALALSQRGTMMPGSLEQAITVAKLIAHSGMVPKQYEGNVGGVLIAIQMGAELGLSPMSSIQNIAVINGRPSLWGDAVLALVLTHPDCEDVIEDDLAEITAAGKATCTVKRSGRAPVVRTFSIEDAKTAGLWGKNVWANYPSRMLQQRARGFALRDAFPDAVRGVSIAEEARDIPAEPEWVTPPKLPEGRQSASGREKPKPEPAKPKPKPEEPAKQPPKEEAAQPPESQADDEPPHNAETGEVLDTTAEDEDW